jgi:hypothetical protein
MPYKLTLFIAQWRSSTLDRWHSLTQGKLVASKGTEKATGASPHITNNGGVLPPPFRGTSAAGLPGLAAHVSAGEEQQGCSGGEQPAVGRATPQVRASNGVCVFVAMDVGVGVGVGVGVDVVSGGGGVSVWMCGCKSGDVKVEM